MIIAIDGPAGSGKSTIARLLAERAKNPATGAPFVYINSGELYRAAALGCLRNGISPEEEERALEYARNARIEYGKNSVFLDGEDVTGLLHTDEIDRSAAPLSAIVPLRHVINDLIRKIAANCDA
ncbi:MAG: (d)CMP kinase, partial [Treponema sp.]|nr:(d)CMP kinase [Treponema sp.]